MAKELTAEDARELLRYEAESGQLFWKRRSEKWFSNTDKRTAAHSAKLWNRNFAGKEALTAISEGYRNGRILNRKYFAHRVIWLITYGELPEGHIDHQNGIRSDNRLANLRCVTRSENQRNMKRPVHNTSGVCGVYWDQKKQKWFAAIGVDGSHKFLGYFDCKKEASACRKTAEIKFGFHENHGR